MKLKVQQLKTHLERQIAPIYLVSGDETLLVTESVQTIATALSQKAFEVQRLQIEKDFDFNHLQHETQSLSLFAEKRAFILQSPSGIPTALNQFLSRLNEDSSELCYVVATPKLTPAQTRSKWYTHVEKIGCHIAIWPLGAKDMPGWIQQRAKMHSLHIGAESIQYLAQITEGNLLAANQAIEKLALSGLQQPIDVSAVKQILSDQSHFDVFQLTHAMLLAKPKRCQRILQSLLAENTEPTIIIWALSKELRLLAKLHEQLIHNPLPQLFKQHQVWPKRQPEVQAGLKYYTYDQCLSALQMLAKLDQIVKGARPGDAMMSLEQWLTQFTSEPHIKRAAPLKDTANF